MEIKDIKLTGKSRLKILQDILDKIRSDRGKEKYFFIIGENGYGMSRFGTELKEAIRNPFFIEHTFYTFYEKTPLSGIFNILTSFFSILEKFPDIKYQIGLKIQKELGDANSTLLDVFPQLSAFVKRSEKKGNFNTALIKLFNILSSSTGLILFLDDLHYCDKSTFAFLNSIAGSEIPITIIATYRKSAFQKIEYYYREVLQKCENLRNYELSLLDKDDVTGIIKSIFHDEIEAPDILAGILMNKIPVTPLLVIETLKLLINEKLLIKQEIWRFNQAALMQMNFPRSFQELLLLRIKRLEKSELEILCYCAAIGRNFDGNLLESISFKNPDLFDFNLIYSTLEKAMDLGIIEIIDNGLYSFASITVRDELYNSMDSELRAVFHLICGEHFEQNFASEGSIIYELAYHYSRSDNLSKGVNYLLKAAEKSRLMYSKDSAVEYCEQALNTLRFAQNIQDAENLKVKITFEYLASLRVMGNFTKGIEMLQDISDIVEKSGNKTDLAYLYFWYGEMHYLLGQQLPAIGWYTRCIPVAEEANLTILLAMPYQIIAGAYIFIGKFRDAASYLEKSLKYTNPTDYANIARTQGFFSWAYGFMGYKTEALEHIQLCEKAVEKIEEEENIIGDYHFIGSVYGQVGQLEKCLEWENKTIALAEKTNNSIMSYSAYYSIGMAYSRKEQFHEAIKLCKRAVLFAEEKEVKIGLHLPYEVLGFSYLQIGEWADAIENAEKALAVSLQLNNFYGSSENTRNIGAAYYRSEKPDFKKAEEYLTKAVQYAENDNYPQTLSLAYAEYTAFLVKSGKTEEAKKYYEKCQTAQKELTNPFVLGLIKKIISDYQTAIAAAPTNNSIKDNELVKTASPDNTIKGITLVKEEQTNFIKTAQQTPGTKKIVIPDGVYALSGLVSQILEITGAANTAECISSFFSSVLAYSGFERGFFYTIQESRLEFAGGRDSDLNDISQDVQLVCKQALRNAMLNLQSVYVKNAIEDNNYKLYQSVHTRKIKSIYVSLVSHKQQTSLVYLENLNDIQEIEGKAREIIKHYQNIAASVIHRLPVN